MHVKRPTLAKVSQLTKPVRTDSAKKAAIHSGLLVHSSNVSMKKIMDANTPGKSRTGAPSASLKITSKGSMPVSDSRRRLWNRQMPVLNCNNCSMSSQCDRFRSGYECAFLPFLHGHVIKTPEDLLHYAKELATENVRRAQQAMMMETMTGGAPSIEVSEQLALAHGQLMALHERVTMTVEATVSGSGGIVESIFGSLNELVQHTKASVVERSDFSAVGSADGPKEVDIEAELVSDLGKFSAKHSEKQEK